MRVRSLADLGNVDSQTPQAQQLKAALADYERSARALASRQREGVHRQGDARVARSPGVRREPQDVLAGMVKTDQELGLLPWEENFSGAVPGRKFEIDLASPALLLGIECDGWKYHGRHKESFLRDRDKDYLLSLQGWVIVRIQAGLVMSDPGEALERVRRFMSVWGPRQRRLLGG